MGERSGIFPSFLHAVSVVLFREEVQQRTETKEEEEDKREERLRVRECCEKHRAEEA